MKRSAHIALLSTGLTLSACDDPPKTQRDVYLGANAVGDCIEDWGDKGKCERRLTREDADRLSAEHRSSGGGYVHPIYFWNSGYGVYGPSYVPGARPAVSNRSGQSAGFVGTRPMAFAAPVAARAPLPTSVPSVPLAGRSGFGATGYGFSGGGG